MKCLKLAALALMGCAGNTVGGEGEAPEECVGRYTGSYRGGVMGSLTANLSADYGFTVTFKPANSQTSYTVDGSVGEDGGIDIESAGSALHGELNFDNCRANGTWQTGNQSGNWTAQHNQ